MTPAWETAVHEAGHAVIGRALRLPCGHATIVPDEDSAGHTITNDPMAIGEHWLDRYARYRATPVIYRARIMGFMAGAEAERELVGSRRDGADASDQREIAFMADDIMDTWSPAWERWEKRLRRHTARLVRKHRVAIERVARELMARRTLQAEEIDALLEPQ